MRLKFSLSTEQVLSQVVNPQMQPVSLLIKHSASQGDEGGQCSEFVRPLAFCITHLRTGGLGEWWLGCGARFTQITTWLQTNETVYSVLGASFRLEVYWKASSPLNQRGLFLWFCCSGLTNGGQQGTVSGWHFSVISPWQLTPAINVKWMQSALQSKGVFSLNLGGLMFGSSLYWAVKAKLLRGWGALRFCSVVFLCGRTVTCPLETNHIHGEQTPLDYCCFLFS